jgi:GAF domain-containing protein
MRNRKALHKIASDLRWKGKVRDVSRGSRYHSFIGVPIRAADGRTIGVIRAVRQRRGGFAEMQQETFETIAATATAIVERLTSSDRTKAMLKVAGQVSLEDGLERFVNSVIVEAARLFIPPADDVAVTRYLPESHEFEIMAAYKSREPYIRTRFPETEGIAGYMLKTREPYRENNLPSDEVRSYVEKIRACIAYPIEFGRKFFGILAVISSRPGVFSERDFGELKLLGEHVTQAFRNAQQYEEARETSDLHSAYLRSLDKIAGLPPPWAPRPLMWRTAEILMREVNFDVIRAFVRGEDSILRCEREWVRRGLSTRCRSSIGAVYAAQGSIGDNDKIPLKITVAPGKTVGLLEVARKDGGASFSILEEKYLGLVAELLSGRLRTEEEMAAAIGASVVASSHDLGHLVVTPRDKLDTLLGDGLPETTASGRVSDDLTFCLRRLNDALEWAKTSMLLTDYRRGDVPSRSEFKLRDFRSEFQEAMEPALARSRWSIRVQVPAETKVRIFIPGFRRIIRDLTYNAVEHGKEDVPLRARAALCKHSRGSRVEISISNGSDTFTPEMARELEERSRTPENMPLGPQYGVGTLLAAVIAKIHGDSLKVRARNSVVRFSFTVPAVLPKRARKGERDGGD